MAIRKYQLVDEEHNPLMQPWPYREVSEKDLCGEARRAIIGIWGKLFANEPNAAAVVAAQVQLATVTPPALKDQLLFVERAAALSKRIDHFVTQAIQSTTICLTYQAFAAELRTIWFHEFAPSISAGISDSDTLIALEAILCTRRLEISLLEQLFDTALFPPLTPSPTPPQLTPAQQASLLLSTLYDAACRTFQTGPTAVYHLAMRLFIHSLLPYVHFLGDWLGDGAVVDPFGEFAVYRDDPTLHPSSQQFFMRGFHLRRVDNASTLPTVPVFLQSIIQKVLDAGRSVFLIRHLLHVSTNPSHNMGREIHFRESVTEKFIHDTIAFFGNAEENGEAAKVPSSTPNAEAEQPQRSLNPTNAESSGQLHEVDQSDTENEATLVHGSFFQGTPMLFAERSRERLTALYDHTAVRLPLLEGALSPWLRPSSAARRDSANVFFGLVLPELPDPLRPPQVYICTCLCEPLERRVHLIGRRALQAMVNNVRLFDHLAALRRLYFMEEGLPWHEFATAVFRRLSFPEAVAAASMSTSFADGDEPSSVMGNIDNDLQISLAEAMSLCGNTFGTDLFSVEYAGGKGALLAGTVSSMNVIANLKFRYQTTWPLDVIITPEVLAEYSKVTAFLLQIKRAKTALDTVAMATVGRRAGSGRGGELHTIHLLRYRLSQFVNNLQHYVMDRVLLPAREEFVRVSQQAVDVAEVVRLHEAYVRKVRDRCLLSPKASRVLSPIVKLLDLATAFAERFARVLKVVRRRDRQQTRRQAQQEVDDRQKSDDEEAQSSAHLQNDEAMIASLLKDCEKFEAAVNHTVGFVIHVLTSVLTQQKQAAHLEDLLLHLNFNGFYVKSDILAGKE